MRVFAARSVVVLALACLPVGCASKHPMEPVITGRPAQRSVSEQEQACMDAAEGKWAARMRKPERESLARERFAAVRSKESHEERKLREALANGEHGGDADLGVTLEIRRALVSEASLSFEAKNLKILTVRGRVTLSGRVASERERQLVEQLAVRVAGSGNVTLRL